MNIIESIHERFVISRRAKVLAEHISRLIPRSANVLDIGCGDGLIAGLICRNRQDINIKGIDTKRRNNVFIPVSIYDGIKIPYDDDEFDYVMLVDVLHHTDDVFAVLEEACRVSRKGLIIKDHIAEGKIQNYTLKIMDIIGNARFSVDLPYNYWNFYQWTKAFSDLKLKKSFWSSSLGLYPVPLSLLFERKMHFVTLLEHP